MYHYDPLNINSFHSYIDNLPNMLIIFHTSTNNIFGAFTTSRFQPKYQEPESTEAFIFSFNSEQLGEGITCFELSRKKEKAKSVVYDDYFLIVGNSEIRWKSGEKIVYSNFAISNGFYETKGTNVWALLKAGEVREVGIKGFECYQVLF